MYQHSFPFIASFLFAAVTSATPVTYELNVDTSSISGTMGSLDFNFNPGPLATQPASLQILNFSTNGALAGACPCGTGDVTGQLPANLTFDNGSGFNDYFDGFTFGTAISFNVNLYGPALTTPDGVSTSGSVFAFSMFSDTAGTIPALTSDTTDGFALTVNVNLDGTTTLTNFSAQADVGSVGSAVPEPSGFAVVGIVMAVCGGLSSWGRRRKNLAHLSVPIFDSTSWIVRFTAP
jgi:hypothetical protein